MLATVGILFFLIKVETSVLCAWPDSKAILDATARTRDGLDVGLYTVLRQQIDLLSSTRTAIDALVFIVVGVMFSVSIALQIAGSSDRRNAASSAAT